MEILTTSTSLVLRGPFDVRSTWEVRQALYALMDGPESQIIVDLTGVDSVDVTALRLLAVATRQAARRGGHVRLRGCSPAVRRMLHLSRLAAAVEVERTTVGA